MNSLGFVALRCGDIERSRGFYELLGLTFAEEKHGDGPRHLSTELDGVVLELYPRRSEEGRPDPTTLGLKVADPDSVGARLLLAGVHANAGLEPGAVRSTDPDGRSIHLKPLGTWDSLQHYAAAKAPDAPHIEHGLAVSRTLCGRAREHVTASRHLWHPYAAHACGECITALAHADH